jgi:hypothetical protein
VRLVDPAAVAQALDEHVVAGAVGLQLPLARLGEQLSDGVSVPARRACGHQHAVVRRLGLAGIPGTPC